MPHPSQENPEPQAEGDLPLEKNQRFRKELLLIHSEIPQKSTLTYTNAKHISQDKMLHIVLHYTTKGMKCVEPGSVERAELCNELWITAHEIDASYQPDRGAKRTSWLHYVLRKRYRGIAHSLSQASIAGYHDLGESESVTPVEPLCVDWSAYPALCSYVVHGSSTPYAKAHTQNRMWAHRCLEKEKDKLREILT